MSRRYVVTGASSGLGAAVCSALAAHGAHVIAAVRDDAAARELTTRLGAAVTPEKFDVTDAAAVNAVAARWESIDGLVNSAGLSAAGPLEWTDAQLLRALFEVNVFGVQTVTRAFLPALKRARGRVVNVSSMAGLVVQPFLGAYAASKFALEALSDAWRLELAPAGVRVSVIEPGALATRMWQRMLETLANDTSTHPQWEVARRVLQGAGKDAGTLDATVADVLHALTSEHAKARYPEEDASALRVMDDDERDALLRANWGLSE